MKKILVPFKKYLKQSIASKKMLQIPPWEKMSLGTKTIILFLSVDAF
jgi:hypothetical protein